MSYSIATLKNDLTGIMHGTSLDSIQGLDNLIDRAARQLLQDIDPAETIRKSQLVGQLYDDVYDYSAPTDLKGSKVIDIRPQVRRGVDDNFSQRFSEDFDLLKGNNTLNVKYNSGTKSLRISKDLRSGIVLNGMDSITANGTWSAGGDASNLTQDIINYVSGSASLRFDLSGATGSGYIENSDFGSVDLSNEEDVGAIFENIFFPADLITNGVTSINVRWGSSSSNYWDKTITTTHDSLAFFAGWNLLREDWATATETGSPDSSAVNYVRITINYTSGTAFSDIRADRVIARLGQIWEIEYYSKYIFSNSGGTFQENVDDDTNTVNLDTDSYNLLLNKCAEYSAQQQSAENSSFDASYFKSEYLNGISSYQSANKKQGMPTQNIYYNVK